MNVFWKDAGERASKTFVQTLLAPLLVSGVGSALHQPWLTLLTGALAAAVLSLGSSLGSLPVGNNGNASLIRDVHTGRPAVTPPTTEVTPDAH